MIKERLFVSKMFRVNLSIPSQCFFSFLTIKGLMGSKSPDYLLTVKMPSQCTQPVCQHILKNQIKFISKNLLIKYGKKKASLA
jgi:hypothetical protein